MLTGNEIREKFLKYFESKGHTIVASSSLVPHDDPTLLFTNAGMNQFKDVFLGLEKRPYTRATTSQKCVRAGGKHNDLDTVGRTARHHTFFEMLGNFSFGDYFKRDAITFAWEFLTKEMGLPQDKLYITIYQDDDEAGELWQELTPVPKERIIKLGEKDNFWAMGDTGPCGPCSEILIDRGEHLTCHPTECGIGKCDCDRFLEIWNLVFMQYNRDEAGNFNPLPRPSIDTGMGLERITSVIQEVASNYDTDLLKKIINSVEELSGKEYHQDQKGFPFRVIADHIRACTFLISDGVMPSNEGRGYVLRRILRRAVRFGKVLNIEKPFMHELVPVVVELMGKAYPEIGEKADYVAKVIKVEEERFHETINEGIKKVNEIITQLIKEGRTEISGKETFLLYDTYGFPVDLTTDIAEEHNLTVDTEGFNQAMEEQRQRARAARQEVNAWDLAMTVANKLSDYSATNFVGYNELAVETVVQGILVDGELVRQAEAGQQVCVVLEKTPFYPEGGGQVGDKGTIIFANGKVIVEQTKKMPDGKIVHLGKAEGLVEGIKANASVDTTLRRKTEGNHTATHILHKALKDVLGDHVNQAGSLVEPDRLRFDFTHFSALTAEEIAQIEGIVNTVILEGHSLNSFEASIEEAKAQGAVALFGEKYGDKVRVVEVVDYSMELCGGTHTSNTSKIGLFKLVSEGAVGAGLRRIEAVTGAGVLQIINEQEALIEQMAKALKCPISEMPRRVEQLQGELKEKEQALSQMEAQQAKEQVNSLMENAKDVDGVKVLSAQVAAPDMDTLRSMADMFRDKLVSGVVILGAANEDKVNLIAAATKDLVGKGIHAGNIIKEIAKVVGGGGGGRPDMAQAGGKDPAKLQEALEMTYDIVKGQIKH